MMTESSEDFIERNCQIVKERMVDQMIHSLNLGKKLVEKELDNGLLNFIFKPVIMAFYDYWSQNDAKHGTMKQIQVTLEAGKKLIQNGCSEQSFKEIFNQYFPKYLRYDQTTRQCYKNHPNFERLKEIAMKTFENYLKELASLLSVKEEVKDYPELCKKAFITKEKAREKLLNQLKLTEESIKIVEEDPSILKVPVGRRVIIRVLRKGFDLTKKEFIDSISEIYELND